LKGVAADLCKTLRNFQAAILWDAVNVSLAGPKSEELNVKSSVTVWFVTIGALGVSAAQAATSDADAAEQRAGHGSHRARAVDRCAQVAAPDWRRT
jgi:hypothetical protein